MDVFLSAFKNTYDLELHERNLKNFILNFLDMSLVDIRVAMCIECASIGGQLELLEAQFRLSTREGAGESLC